MCDEPQAVREIHEIRRKMAKEFEGLSITEIRKRISKGAQVEMERIYGKKKAAEAREEYGTGEK